MTEKLPKWVYDLVMELEERSDHPTLYFTSGAFKGNAKYDWCPCNALDLVPQGVRDAAAVLAAYRRESEKDKTPPGGEGG